MSYTRKSLRAACFAALRSADLRLTAGRLDDCRARLDERGGVARVTIDPHQSSMIEGAVHECLHIVLDVNLLPLFSRHERGKSLWELTLDMLETVIAEDVLSSPEETEKWRRAIDRKLSRPSS